MLVRSNVSSNYTTGAIAKGGGVRTSGDFYSIQSTVSENRTIGRAGTGGGIYADGTVQLHQSTVSGNRARGERSWGGGIFAREELTSFQSTISGNRTTAYYSFGGGIFALSSVDIQQTTITNNRALKTSGGGLWGNSRAADYTIENSILSGNSSAGFSFPDVVEFGTLRIENSLIGRAVFPDQGEGNVISDDPRLAPLANNGGITKDSRAVVTEPCAECW